MQKLLGSTVVGIFGLVVGTLGLGIVIASGCNRAPRETGMKESLENGSGAETKANEAKPETTGEAADQANSNASVRFATYNVSLYREQAGQLIEDLRGGSNEQCHSLATVIQQVRPDVLLINEFDYDGSGEGARLFCEKYLNTAHDVDGTQTQPIAYPYRFSAESNTGLPSGTDFNRDQKTDGPEDCFGFGRYPGQYGMLVLSKYPIQRDKIRTFQKFLWKDMPNAKLPTDPNSGEAFYSTEALSAFRLSSKSHWDVPVNVLGTTVHFLVCHPTPPVFDGPEDRNGKRNHDEIRFFADYVDPSRSSYIVDDQGTPGGLQPTEVGEAHFVIAGDLNADPFDGDSHKMAVRQLLDHPMINASTIPASAQAALLGSDGANTNHQGNPAHDTADFDDRRTGNLRIDYVLPSKNLNVVGSGVFWPDAASPLEQHTKATDHRLVYIDLSNPK